MLRFTKQQQDFVLANRRAFNARQKQLAEAHPVMLVGNASTLPKDVWGEWDREGIEVQRAVMAVFNDLAASVSVAMPIGKLVHHFQTISDSGNVNVSIDGRSKARTDQPVIEYHGTPLPILDSTYGFGWRDVEAARTEGMALDAAASRNAMFKIAEQLETHALDGNAKIVVGGAQLYGLRTHPKRGTRATGATLNGATGAQWQAEFVATLKVLHTANYRVPATIYLNWDDWFYASNTDYSTTKGDKTILQRMQEIAGVGSIVPASKVAANEIIATVKDRRSVQVLNGLPMTTRAKFRADIEDDYDFIATAAAAVEIKFDAEDNCGIAHSS